jgi:pyrroloquinoline quinone biosynthesis protein E
MNDRPIGLLAELTHRCPLHCPYCSNPLALAVRRDELATDDWLRVLDEARALGVLQLHLSGGEPLLRRDLAAIIARARVLGLYTNLITSAFGLTRALAERLQEAGLDHVQISLQAADAALSDRLAGTRCWDRKLSAARAVKGLGLPLTLNCVLHRQNIDEVGAIIAMAVELGADRLELANTQYYGWALRNRAALLPAREQVERAESAVRAARERLAGRPQLIYVPPDYYGPYPKPCLGGWGRRQLTVAPDGNVLPCPAAGQMTGLPIENVRRRSLLWIWEESPMFNRFRGTGWMPEPCRSCPRREIDFGGCRCQALQLTGDAAAADPACHLSPHHAVVEEATRAAAHGDDSLTEPGASLVYRFGLVSEVLKPLLTQRAAQPSTAEPDQEQAYFKGASS